jgi:hypothetical protein
VGRPEPRLLLRRPRAGDRARREERLNDRRRTGLDGAVVPGLLLLLARDLALYHPTRVLAWRLTHDERLSQVAGVLGPLLPRASGALDRDPIALLLAGLAVLLALAYAALALASARAAARALVLALAATLLVVAPSVAFIALGAATHRPYGQDGGVVQLPLAIDKILAGQSPYGADYSGTILERQARVSSFWAERGGNPILHHHAYLPGTHLVMAPFLLASRAAFGFFDPRLVTLLFYGLVVALAARVPSGAEARLAAAGIAALNPLVYWHQIFGANDLVFVAMLLGTVLLARREKRVAAGALLGLACATKQLAWPYAPFLLVALAGARSWRDLAAPATWRRLLPPLAACALVFLVVVLPVAALDLRAFWGDIVVYNVGLPGGDNYPLGGTPGFGAANFLIYFGHVRSLADYFPFSVFYVVLVPIGLLLLRSQLRDASVPWALATGSAALVASVYFSRVAHPNYLIPAAILLPLAVLAGKRAADVAIGPLLLLGLAVEIAEGALFQTTWEQAASAGLPTRAGGVVAALAPRAGPALTHDPLGLLASGIAAGLGMVYLVMGAGGAGRKARVANGALGLALLVAGPVAVMAGVSDRTGIVRAQDPRVVQTEADAKRLGEWHSPYTPPPETLPRGREAVSSSFRLDPPAEFQPRRPLLPPGPAVLSVPLRAAGLVDPRWLGLLALAALGGLLAAYPGGRPSAAAVAVALLAGPLALGTVLGSPLAPVIALLVAAWWRSRREQPAMAGVLAGAAVALDHRALLIAPLLLVSTPRRRRAIAGAALAYAAIVVPVILLDPGSFLRRLAEPTPPGPGLGVFNLLAYRGVEASAGSLALAALAPLLAAAVGLALLRWGGSGPARAGVAALAALALAPAASPEAVALPLVLLTLGAATDTRFGGEPAPP